MKKIMYSLSATVLLLWSCSQEKHNGSITESDISSMNELEVPDGFDYSMVKKVDFDLSVFASPFEGKARVDFFLQRPGQGRVNVQTIAVTPVDTVPVEIQVPSVAEGIMAEATLANGKVLKGKWAFNTAAQTLVLEDNWQKPTKVTSTMKTTTPGPGCTTGCTTVITSVSGNKLEVPSNQTYCITGGLSGKELEIKPGATARLCGTFTNVKDIKLQSGATLIINDNAVVQLNNGNKVQLNQNAELKLYDGASLTVNKELRFGQGNTLLNFGTITVKDKDFQIQQGATVLNHGSIVVDLENLEIIGNGSLTNHGTIRVKEKDFEVHNQGMVVNNGTIIDDKSDVKLTGSAQFTNNGSLQILMFASPGGDLIMNNQSVFTNTCNTTVNDDLLMYSSAKFINQAGLYVVDDIELYNQSELEMAEQTIATVGDNLTAHGRIKALGTAKSLVKIANTVSVFNSAQFSGPLSMCLNGGTINFGSATVASSVVQDCSVFIPTDACTTVGNGSNPDADGDGVPDATDQFPNDPARAFSTTGAVSTLIAEDLWPYTGDFDFNDLVMEYQFDVVTDGNAEVKEFTYKYMVKARGAGYDNGFGFLLTTPQGNIASVTGGIASNSLSTFNTNGTETGALSTGVGFMVTDKLRENLPFWNTVPNAVDVSTPVYQSFTVVFTTPVDASVLTTFNPFLVVDQNRGKEIHLPNNIPSDLVNTALFGTGEDVTDLTNSISYVTASGLPWMMSVPANFSYVAEREDITQAYLNFAAWAASGGTTNLDWYVTSVTGNVDQSKLY